MRKVILSAVFLAIMTSAAYAHPGSRILTVGGEDGRHAMTSGVSYEDTSGVHVFRGRPSLDGGQEAPAAESALNASNGDVIIYNGVWRSFRPLRTQGFYSGRNPKTRRYTQGFYSDQ